MNIKLLGFLLCMTMALAIWLPVALSDFTLTALFFSWGIAHILGFVGLAFLVFYFKDRLQKSGDG